MGSLKAIVEANLKVSEALETLNNLKKEETQYFEERELQALENIKLVLVESSELLRECNENYLQISEFKEEITQFASKLKDLHEGLIEVQEEFQERDKLWKEDLDRQFKLIEEKRNKVNADRIALDNERRSFNKEKKRLDDGFKKLESDRGTINRTIERLKNNRI